MNKFILEMIFILSFAFTLGDDTNPGRNIGASLIASTTLVLLGLGA